MNRKRLVNAANDSVLRVARGGWVACLALLVLAAGSVPKAAFAQTDASWPSRPIRFIVPYPPAGPTDLMARILAPRMQQALGVTVIVDNRAGAAGNIGTDMVAKSAPDGYTLLLAASGPMAVNPTLMRSTPYNPLRDLAPVVQISSFPLVLEVPVAASPKTVREFVTWVKARPPGSVSYGSAGNGTPQHLAGALFDTVAGTTLQHVPYKGAGPALSDLMGGQISAMFDIVGSSVGHIRGGKLRALAVTGQQRSQALPSVPTMAEAGFAGVEIQAWHGIAVAAATPPAVVARLNAVVVKIFEDAEVRARWAEIGSDVVAGTPAQFGALIRAESTRLGKLVHDIGATED
jgi:tripartite-type tricarboxylate transporter receptor subunit TctC